VGGRGGWNGGGCVKVKRGEEGGGGGGVGNGDVNGIR